MKTQASNALLSGLLDVLKADTSSVINSALGAPVRPENSPLYDRSLSHEQRLSGHKALVAGQIVELKRQADELKTSDKPGAIELTGQAVTMARELLTLLTRGEQGLKEIDAINDLRPAINDLRTAKLPETRLQAIRALECIGNQDALQALIKFGLTDPVEENKLAAIEVLGRSADLVSSRALCAQLEIECSSEYRPSNGETIVGDALVMALGKTSEPEIIDWLKQKALNGEYTYYWEYTSYCISALALNPERSATEAIAEVYRQGKVYIENIGEPMCFARTLLDQPLDKHKEELICQMLLDTPSKSLAEALQGTPYPETLKWLREIGLTHTSEHTRAAAATALQGTSDTDALALLEDLSREDPSLNVQECAAITLAVAKKPAALLCLLRNPSTGSACRFIIKAFNGTNDHEAQRALYSLAMGEFPSEIRKAAATALQGTEDPDILRSLIESPVRAGIREWFRPALTSLLHEPGLAPRLRALLELSGRACKLFTGAGRERARNWVNQRRLTTILALSGTKDPEATKALCQIVLKDGDYEARIAAAEALYATTHPETLRALASLWLSGNHRRRHRSNEHCRELSQVIVKVLSAPESNEALRGALGIPVQKSFPDTEDMILSALRGNGSSADFEWAYRVGISDNHIRIRAFAAHILKGTSNQRALRALREQIVTFYDDSAALALQNTRDEKTLRWLAKGLIDQNQYESGEYELWLKALHGTVHPAGIDALRYQLSQDLGHILNYKRTFLALAASASPLATTALFEVLLNPEYLKARKALATSLEMSISPELQDWLVNTALHSTERDVAKSAASLLQNSSDPEVKRALTEAGV